MRSSRTRSAITWRPTSTISALGHNGGGRAPLRFFKQFELNGPGREGHFNRLALRWVQFLRFLARVLEYPPMRHRLDQQFGQPPHQRIETVRRVACPSPVKVGGEGAHLVLQLGGRTDAMD